MEPKPHYKVDDELAALRALNDDLAEAPIAPDTQDGAFTNCECSHCRERRLADPDRIAYTAGEMADAYTQGWKDGYHRGQQRR